VVSAHNVTGAPARSGPSQNCWPQTHRFPDAGTTASRVTRSPQLSPGVRIAALENRRFLQRSVAFLVREAGIRQFLDIGTGIPTANNTHEVAQAIVPESRIVYVDNDPIVLAHARALLTSSPEGATAYIDADLREPEKILNHPDLLRTLDLSQPVGLVLAAILHVLTDAEEPYVIVSRLLDALASGSYLVASNATMDFASPQERQQAEAMTASGRHGTMRFRSRDEFGRFFDGLELVEPGICSLVEWRAEDEMQPRPSATETGVFGAVARKP
jgi:hypothetical protein